MSDSERDAWLEGIIAAIERNNARPRKHAGYYDWYDKDTKHSGIAAEFCRELARNHGITYSFASESEIGGAPVDPPDIVLKDTSGSLVGLEITELVNKPAIYAQIAKRPDYDSIVASFDEDAAIESLHAIVIRKELAAVNVCTAFAEYLLLVHCAEPWLSREHLARVITAHAWPKTRGIRAAYLMFDYEPIDRRPIVRLF